MAAVDYSVYLVTDRGLCNGRDLLEVVGQAVQGGVSLVQLREKSASTRDFLELGKALAQLLRPSGTPLLVNDRVDIALAIGAGGVHIGQSDMPYADARRLLGPEAIIGVSVETMEQVEQAEAWDVDYLGVSPVFNTSTKTDTTKPWGLDGLSQVRRQSSKPLVAIGGLGAHNAAGVIRAGADGIAVVSAICSAQDPASVVQELRCAVCKEL